MPRQIQLSPSRIVEGNVYKSSNIGMNGQIKAKPEFYFAVAIAKNDPRLGEIWGAYHQEALASYANNQNVLQRIQRGLVPNSGFAWKISDGDAPERRERPGQAGCWIFKFKTTWEIKVVDQKNQPINATLLRTGYYCDVLANLAGNGKTDHTAGLYANPVFVRWLFPGYGEEIQPGPQADKVLGAAPTQLPPGATPSAQGGMGGASQGMGFQSGSHGHNVSAGGVQASVPGMGGGAGAPAGAQPHNVGYQAPAAASYEAPGGQVAGNPQTTGGQMNTGNSYNAPGASASPGMGAVNNPQGGVAGGPAAMGAAMPAGAHYTQAQPGSPTASHSSASVPGFAHGNPGGQ